MNSKQILAVSLLLGSGFSFGMQQEVTANQEQKKILNAALKEAVKSGNAESAKKSLKNGADADTKNELLQVPLLSSAVEQSNQEIVQLLLDYNADAHAANIFGETAFEAALSWAAIRNDEKSKKIVHAFLKQKHKMRTFPDLRNIKKEETYLALFSPDLFKCFNEDYCWNSAISPEQAQEALKKKNISDQTLLRI